MFSGYLNVLCQSWLSHGFEIDLDASGAIYTTAWAGPALGLAQAGPRLVHLYLLPRPDLHQCHIIMIMIITANASSICYTSVLKLCLPDSR